MKGLRKRWPAGASVLAIACLVACASHRPAGPATPIGAAPASREESPVAPTPSPDERAPPAPVPAAVAPEPPAALLPSDSAATQPPPQSATTASPPAVTPAPSQKVARKETVSAGNSPPTRPAPEPPATPLAPTAAPAMHGDQGATSQPTLDLASLEQRLRDTRAIGVFTKLSLKNQVDDLLAAFKEFHQGHTPPTLSALRQTYELLLMKVVTLLQNGDPGLASAVSASRDSIWALLADPRKFAQISENRQEPTCAGADLYDI